MDRATIFRKLRRMGFVSRRVWLTPEQAKKVDEWDKQNRALLNQNSGIMYQTHQAPAGCVK